MNMGDERHNHDVTIGLAFINVDIYDCLQQLCPGLDISEPE